jgi:hypothetical protein
LAHNLKVIGSNPIPATKLQALEDVEIAEYTSDELQRLRDLAM